MQEEPNALVALVAIVASLSGAAAIVSLFLFVAKGHWIGVWTTLTAACFALTALWAWSEGELFTWTFAGRAALGPFVMAAVTFALHSRFGELRSQAQNLKDEFASTGKKER